MPKIDNDDDDESELAQAYLYNFRSFVLLLSSLSFLCSFGFPLKTEPCEVEGWMKVCVEIKMKSVMSW